MTSLEAQWGVATPDPPRDYAIEEFYLNKIDNDLSINRNVSKN